MWFLTKCAFWLTVVVLVLPVPESERRADVRYASAGDAVSVLSAALADAGGFCGRNPEACVTGARTVQGLAAKAQIATRMLHEFVSGQVGEASPAPAATAALPRPASPVPGQDTLTASDREPGWRQPQPAVAPSRRT